MNFRRERRIFSFKVNICFSSTIFTFLPYIGVMYLCSPCCPSSPLQCVGRVYSIGVSKTGGLAGVGLGIGVICAFHIQIPYSNSFLVGRKGRGWGMGDLLGGGGRFGCFFGWRYFSAQNPGIPVFICYAHN